ncbi:diphthine--ammonia ligase-like isoform X2 [Asterias rubens]|uniref:diphthine--ammonia ligase-like isoform X2 n=1 Tax=Asterias rubens TaxID=7604 RepID=UPI00145559D4|nr:diphthine--ammonia ligase-like isoform X2 [Asterias rubens]
MKVVALISGGKDSCYNMMQCVAEGHQLVALANLRPKQTGGKSTPDELDSYMYQTVGHHAIDLYAEAMGLPLYRGCIEGTSMEQGRDYEPTEGDEVEDLYTLLQKIKNDLGVDGVSVGAILSNYQRVRVENVCTRLGLTPLAFLWRRNQEELLKEMITAGVEAIIIKVAALGLEASHLGKTLQEIQPHMMRMKDKYQLNVCGEGGEFETFTLDCPLFSKKMKIKHQEAVNHSDDAFASVHYLNLLSMDLEDKQIEGESFSDRLRQVPMKRGTDLHQEMTHLMVKEPVDNPGDIDKHKYQVEGLDTVGERSPPICKTCHNGYMWISGIAATHHDDRTIAESTEQAMADLKDVLANHGYSLSDAVIVHLYVQDMSNFSKINSVWCKHFKNNPPARVCVQVSLPPHTALQIDCLAHKNTATPHDDGDMMVTPPVRNTMYVQSISHWAPANLGPYSQAVQIGDLIFSAGTIGLCPSTMQPIEGGITPQCALSLRSLKRVLAAMDPKVTTRNVVGGVCFVTDAHHLTVARQHWERLANCEEELCTDSPPSMICYVVVPRLPKEVLVEWHVVASISSEPWHYTTMTVNGKASSSELQMMLNTQNSSGLITCKTTLRTDTDCNVLVDDFLCAVEVFLTEWTYSWNSALSVRLFYRQELLQHEQLLSVLVTGLGKSSPVCPAVCLVPVLSLPGSYALTALIFLQQ